MTETDESPNRRTAPRIAIAAATAGALLIAIAAVGVLLFGSRHSTPEGEIKPIVAVHGGYTSELDQDPKTLKDKQDSIAWVNRLLGASTEQRQGPHDAESKAKAAARESFCRSVSTGNTAGGRGGSSMTVAGYSGILEGMEPVQQHRSIDVTGLTEEAIRAVEHLVLQLRGQQQQPKPSSAEDWKQVFNAWMLEVRARADRYPPGFVVDDSRESIYGDDRE
jgi:hypothetical protein